MLKISMKGNKVRISLANPRQQHGNQNYRHAHY